MNYIISFLLCVVFTVMAALVGSPNVHWLIVSDFNVAIWLLVAWFLGGR